jgi:YVTN family beta-propeller protein
MDRSLDQQDTTKSMPIEEEATIMMRYSCIGWFVAVVAVALGPGNASAQPPMELESKIPLGDVSGRIDHLAIDLPRRRLFVAELGNNTVGVVDLNERKVVHVIAGLKEPQGVGYLPSTDTLFVANAVTARLRPIAVSEGTVLAF